MAVTEQMQDTECMQQIRQELHHIKRRLDGQQKLHNKLVDDYHEVVADNARLEVTLTRTSLKSKRRLKSIRGLEQALRMERLRHGYIKMEDMTHDQRWAMLADIATHKTAAKLGWTAGREPREQRSE